MNIHTAAYKYVDISFSRFVLIMRVHEWINRMINFVDDTCYLVVRSSGFYLVIRSGIFMKIQIFVKANAEIYVHYEDCYIF